jgi:hypothetical protein
MTRLDSEILALRLAITLLDDTERYYRSEIGVQEVTDRNLATWQRAYAAGPATVKRMQSIIARRLTARRVA